jgi:hypothetical protein
LLGLTLGAAGCLTSRSPRPGLAGALSGLVLGAIAGAGTSYAGIPVFYRFRYTFEEEIVASFLLHGAMWGAVGGAAALALGVASGGGWPRTVRCLLGGALGALLGTAVYELIGAAFFATADTSEPISTTASTRLLARLLVGSGTVLGAMTGFRQRSRPGKGEPPP